MWKIWLQHAGGGKPIGLVGLAESFEEARADMLWLGRQAQFCAAGDDWVVVRFGNGPRYKYYIEGDSNAEVDDGARPADGAQLESAA